MIVALGCSLAPTCVGVRLARAQGARDFDQRVAPVLIRRCLDCHSGFEPKGGLDLSRRATAMQGGDSGEAIVPGKPGESLLWENVADGSMPPKSRLTGDEKAILHDWIAAGAPWGADPIDVHRFSTERRAGRDWWSLQPLVRPMVPAVGAVRRVANPIDAFVVQRLDAAGLAPAPPADRRVLVRRLAFDLTGLPPTPEEVEAFVGDDRPDAYERLVERYLASPQYGVRWGRLWLDLARYGESNGFEHDEFRPEAWPYRDWVVNSLNSDLPYDEFARRQLAGDVLFPQDPEAVEATGFLVAGAYDSVGQEQQSEAMRRVVRQDDLEDMVSTVGQTFLGLTIHCARCHDHKFDPIGQSEYYRMAAALAGVRHGVRDLAPLEPEVAALRRRIAALVAQVAAIEAPVRATLRAARSDGAENPPVPIARWDFDRDARDQAGGLHLALEGESRLVQGGLRIDVKSGAVGATTAPLAAELRGRTLEAWVQLEGLEQAGGAVIGVQTLDGGTVLDALVYGRPAGHWAAGSGKAVRTLAFDGPKETEADRRPVHLALVYSDEGTVTAYRQGMPYGTPYHSGSLTTFAPAAAQVVFGLGPGLPGVKSVLAGTIVRARLYDRALTAAEVARSQRAVEDDVADRVAIDASLAPHAKAVRDRCQREIDALWATIAARVRKVYTVTPRPSGPIHRLVRGNPAQPAEVVTAGGLQSLAGVEADFGLAPDAPDAERRRRLAAWITDPKNSLFARAIVNRLWQGHFGAGFVETPSDLGFQGGKPSHPELLDWLACELVAQGYRLKPVHRLLVTSATYRQSSRLDPAAARVDTADRLLWREAPLRLDAEAVRDAMLAVSGALDFRRGGPGFREFAITNAPGTITNQYTPLEAVGSQFDRRTLYRTWARGGRSRFLDAFDCPDPSTSAPRRPVTTTPLQALALLNNALTLRLADRLAERLRHEAGDDPGRQVERAYLLCFGRVPDESEREGARRVLANHGAAVLARALFNSNEFLYVD
jgi:hypothetical protein